MKKPFFFIVIIFLFLFLTHSFFPDFYQLTKLEYLQAIHLQWLVLYQENPFITVLVFFAFNVLMAMLPVPGISMISFLGGALFGFYYGAFWSSLATAIGNLAGFFLARYFLRDWVMKVYGYRVKAFQDDWQKKGAFALLSMRLFPLIPSFVANLVIGVSPLHWWTFFWVGWIGRLPMVLIYAKAGEEIASLTSLQDILSPSFVISFSLLALLPWGLDYFRRRLKAL